MDWQPEKLCSAVGEYDLLIERFKHGYQCEQSNDTWKWRVIHSGVILSQGTSADIATAQKMAESNVPLNS
jgi:hypothetical protein